MAHYDPPGILVLMHNRLGMRIEFNAAYDGRLNLWFSPLAGKSTDCRERNFSNRDDQTPVFDRISLPGLSQENFLKCNYDPFHSVIHFRDQELHLLSHYEHPALVLWTTRPQAVDFKSNPDDQVLERTESSFVIRHQDRWHRFHFTARVTDNWSSFIHQTCVEEGRSDYARANLHNSAPLVIFAALEKESGSRVATQLASASVEDHLAMSRRSVNAALVTGRIQLNGHRDWSRLHSLCRRHLLSARDISGAVRAALSRIYYMIWVRDGALIENTITASGWSDGAGRWQEFLLANPTIIDRGTCQGRAFLMLVNQITKWEEDGLFYAVWSAFTAWSHWGRELSREETMALEDAVSWLERYCFSTQHGLFGRSYAGESPFFGSHDFGFDNAVGNPCDTPPPMVEDGRRVLVSYDLYINETAFSVYCMMASMLPGERGSCYLSKAVNLRDTMSKWFERNELPPYGWLLLEDGELISSAAYGLDLTDYVWGCSLPPFPSHPHRINDHRARLLQDIPGHTGEYFLAGYFSLLGALDPWDVAEEEIEKAIDYAVAQSVPAGSKLAMPYAIKEMLDVADGDRWHDVRPQSFSAGPFIACLSGLLLRKLPFGLAVRSSGLVRNLKAYAYRGKRIDVVNECPRATRKMSIRIAGHRLAHSLQVPESLLESTAGKRLRIEISPASKTPTGPVLLSSTMKLNAVEVRRGRVLYHLEGFGFNSLRFAVAKACKPLVEKEGSAAPVKVERHRGDGDLHLAFWGRGDYTIQCPVD